MHDRSQLPVVDETEAATPDGYARLDPCAGWGINDHALRITTGDDHPAAGATGVDNTLTWLAETLHGIGPQIGSHAVLIKLGVVSGALRDNGSLQEISGVEVSYVGTEIGFDDAAARLRETDVRSLLFATPDGWTLLVPLSQPRTRKFREMYVARLHGLFDGKLAEASFELSHVARFGGFEDGSAPRVELIDGKFLDRNDRTYADSIFRDGSTVRSRAASLPSKKRTKRAKRLATEPSETRETDVRPEARATCEPDGSEASAKIVALNAAEVLEITELSPANGAHAGKRIDRRNVIQPYPQVAEWTQAVTKVPATIAALYGYLCEARRDRNVILIRGAPANLSRQLTRRHKAFEKDRGDHGFVERPTPLLFLDLDGIKGLWQADPAAAVARVKLLLGEPFASASAVWFFSGSHGLEKCEVATGKVDTDGKPITQVRWTGQIVDGSIRLRLAFLTKRPLSEAEAVAFTKVTEAASGIALDASISYRVQPNYIRRIRWEAQPDQDPLGNTPTIGWIEGTHERVAVPDNLAVKARWAKAEGVSAGIAEHPTAIAAVRAAGSDGRIREHLKAAVLHLVRKNPQPKGVSTADHAASIAAKLATLVTQEEAEIRNSLAAGKRQWGDVTGYLPDNMADWAHWVLEHLSVLNRKTIRRAFRARPAADPAHEKQVIFDRVLRVIAGATEGVTLLIAPPGSRKSTLVRAMAVAYVAAHPGKTVVILVPRHRLGDEQIEALCREHPQADFRPAIWRGRDREDPEAPDPEHPGQFRKMCWRTEEAKACTEVLIPVEEALCKRGSGDDAVYCPHYDQCGFQRTKQMRGVNIWFAAHEMLGHEMPAAFGKVRRVVIDESPIDALSFGTDANDEVELSLDALKTPQRKPPRAAQAKLMAGREALHEALEGLPVPDDWHKGAPATREVLYAFLDDVGRRADPDPPPMPEDPWAALRWSWRYQSNATSARHPPGEMATMEWKDVERPPITPDMSARQVRELLKGASRNAKVKRLVAMWNVLGAPGRLQLHGGDDGRTIRLVGLREITKGWNVPTLICDGTGDATLLRAIWPDLKCDLEDDWRTLPRPDNVRIVQCVDRAVSKNAVAIEARGQEPQRELAERERAARRLYAAIMAKALDYGGAEIGVVVYKSTEAWIRKNCFVPDWVKLAHHGDLAGSNALEKVRALFVVGRTLPPAEAVTRSTEALTGDYIAERDYVPVPKGGAIPIVPDAVGNNVILIDVWRHPDPVAERRRRQDCEAALIQAVERARGGLRGPGEPLDIHLWTDVPLPELGEVEPVLWDELEVGLDWLMLASGAVWLENITHAAKAYSDLLTDEGIKKERSRARAQPAKAGAVGGGVGTFPIGSLIGNVPTPLLLARYQLAGAGQKFARAASLLGPDETRAWLEARLGPLAKFDIEVLAEDDRQAAE